MGNASEKQQKGRESSLTGPFLRRMLEHKIAFCQPLAVRASIAGLGSFAAVNRVSMRLKGCLGSLTC